MSKQTAKLKITIGQNPAEYGQHVKEVKTNNRPYNANNIYDQQWQNRIYHNQNTLSIPKIKIEKMGKHVKMIERKTKENMETKITNINMNEFSSYQKQRLQQRIIEW